MSIINLLLDLLFPPVCLSCNYFGETICQKCLDKFQTWDHLICPDCLQQSEWGTKHPNCDDFVDGLVFVWHYNETAQKIIKQIKYQGYFAVCPDLVKLFCQNLEDKKYQCFKDFLQTQPILLPVPLHSKRQNWRGFNQSEILGKYFAKNFKLEYSFKILQRIRNTKPQADLKKKERQENIKDAFDLNPKVLRLGEKPLAKKNFLLIDDVFTTGATMQNCAKILKKYGAEKMWALSLCH
ncbi:ComF family protein [Candidatus Beckwithbacteria bacterium]|nr:ComF family protein [Candidatus Beckwithbacteria bacterium]